MANCIVGESSLLPGANVTKLGSPRFQRAHRMIPPTLRALTMAVLLVAAATFVAADAGAQIPPILTTTTTTPGSSSSSTSSSSTSSSTTTSTGLLPPATTSTVPDETTTTTTPVEEGQFTEFPIVPGGDGAPPIDEAIGRLTIPGWALEQINSVPRSGGNGTAKLIEALQPLLAYGFTPEEIARIGFGRFPVAGEARFADDWWYPRFTPDFHLHEGTDIFAGFATSVIAPFDGVVTMGEGRVGGLYTYLTVEDGTYYYFAHLDQLPVLAEESRITDPLAVERYAFREFDQPVAYRVKAGDVIGTVGDTGNAKGGSPHLHFEVHPGGGEATNPKPILDQWLKEAEVAAPGVVALYTSSGPKAVISTQRTRAGGAGQFAAPSRPLAAEILGVSSVGPGTGVQVVTEEVVRAVSRIDWAAQRAALARPLEDLSAALAAALS